MEAHFYEQRRMSCNLVVAVVEGEPVGRPGRATWRARAVLGVFGHRFAKAAALWMATPQRLAACAGGNIPSDLRIHPQSQAVPLEAQPLPAAAWRRKLFTEQNGTQQLLSLEASVCAMRMGDPAGCNWMSSESLLAQI